MSSKENFRVLIANRKSEGKKSQRETEDDLPG